jgi:amino acid adenylation domain-containing protein
MRNCGNVNKELGERLAALSPEQIKALVSRVKRESGAGASGLRRVARADGERHPLSSAQERLWFLAQLSPDSRVLNNPGALRARTSAPLDRALFQRSLEEVARRHEILRTTFHSFEGSPVQVVHERMELTVGWEDLTHLPEEQREREAERLAVEEGRQVFDLSNGPLIAMKILRLGELDYTLLITSHHIISDGWSMAMFSTEVASIYNALEAGRPHGLPDPEFQYVDYVYWEREWARGEKFREHLDYWKRQFADEPEPLRLPTDRPRPHVLSDAGSIESLTLRPELAASLKAFARGEGATLFEVLMAALGALLYRYTGQEDLVVGTSAANRNRRETQNVMGLFINTLPVRTRVRGVESFRAYLRRVGETCREALVRQELPFEKLIGELNPRRSLNAHPLFQVMLVHQNVPALYVVPGMRLELLKLDYGTAKFDLNLWVEEMNEELLLTLHYSRDLFDAATARRILAHFRALLEAAARDPECPVKRLPYLTREERDSALRRADASNDFSADASENFSAAASAESAAGGDSFQRRFEARAAERPAAVAVECPGESITYRELNSRANRLARRLRREGVGAEARVALLAERGPRALVGVLGVLKAGAAYLPLDPANPTGRLRELLEDSRARVLLADEHTRALAESLASGDTPLRVVHLDADCEDAARGDEENPEFETTGEQLAYVIYTSGTTGRPKGVCVEQRNLVNYCDAVWREMKLSAGDRFACVSPLAADLGHTMLFPVLARGGTVVAVPPEMATDAAALADYFERAPVDCMKIVPSHLRALLDSAHARKLLPRKLLVLGGEAATTDLVEQVRAAGAGCRIINHYGPTECTVGVLTYEVPEADAARDPDGRGGARGLVPTGYPLAGCKVYVLDDELEPVPVGVAGEVYVGGACVSRGYLRRPALTAERFVPDPFGAGARLYRTGDRAKVVEGGAVQFLGRVDRQVKVRGFRVELPEIEIALGRHPGVESAVVLPPEETAGRLVAFVRTRRGDGPDAAALRQHLSELLPAHMIPNAFVLLDEMPLTPAGKVDYRALARLEVAEPPRDEQHRPPRDEVELALMLIWQELLRVEPVGVADNFFEMGGHSLLAVQLVSRVEQRFGLRLPLASLFEFGSVEELAALIRREKTAGPTSPLVLIRKGSGRKLFFVHPAGGNVLCYYDLARSLGDGLEFYGVQATPGVVEVERGDNGARGDDGARNSNGSRDSSGVHHGNGSRDDGKDSRERVSVEAMARRYLDAVLPACGDELPVFGGWSMGALVAFEMGRLYAREFGRSPLVAVLDQLAPDADGARADVAGEVAAETDEELPRLLSFSAKVSQLVGRDLGLSEAALAGLSEGERAGLFLEKFKAARLVPESTGVEGFRGFLELMITHNRITAEYAPGVYDGRVVVFRAEESSGLEPLSERVRAHDLGWQRYTSRPVEVVGVPGSHVTMITRPNVRALAAALAARAVQRR